MSVEPGFGGQSFIPEVLGKVRTVRSLVDSGRLGIPRRDRRRDQRRHHRTGRRGRGGLLRRRLGRLRCRRPGTGRRRTARTGRGALADGHRGRRVGAGVCRPDPRRGDGAPIAESGAAMGSSSPNPPVGAVVIGARGEVIAVRHTTGRRPARGGGGAHGGGEAARGATVVVTLEPCNHTGRTGPVFASPDRWGVARVVYALADPNPLAAGGAQALRDAGIAVVAGFGSEIAADGRCGPGCTASALAAVGDREDRDDVDGRVAAPRRDEPMDPPGLRPGLMHTSCAGVWTPSSSAPAPFWPMTRRSPRAPPTGRWAPINRSGSSWAIGTYRRGQRVFDDAAPTRQVRSHTRMTFSPRSPMR